MFPCSFSWSVAYVCIRQSLCRHVRAVVWRGVYRGVLCRRMLCCRVCTPVLCHLICKTVLCCLVRTKTVFVHTSVCAQKVFVHTIRQCQCIFPVTCSNWEARVSCVVVNLRHGACDLFRYLDQQQHTLCYPHVFVLSTYFHQHGSKAPHTCTTLQMQDMTHSRHDLDVR